MIRKLKEWSKIHEKSPSVPDITNDPSMPSVRTIKNHFGTFNNAKREAGLEVYIHDSELNYLNPILKKWKNGRQGEITNTTIENYLRALLKLQEHLEEQNKSLETMNFDDIKAYILKIKDRYTKRTMDQKFNAIRNFLMFFNRNAKIKEEKPKIPFDEATIEAVRVLFKTQLIKLEDISSVEPALMKEEVQTIKEKLKDYPLLDTLFRLDLNLGLRANEFVEIKVIEGLISNRNQARKKDVWIDLSRGILMIYRKKSKRPHLVALTSEMVQLVKKQLMLRKLYGIKHEFLFFSKKGKHLKKQSIFSYYQQISEIVDFKVTSHRVRRTMATLLDEAGIPHAIIRMRLGHAPKDDTDRYKQYSIKRQQEILEERVGIL